MAISIMQRLELIALREDADELIKRLTWLSCVEVESEAPPDSTNELVRASFDTELSEVRRNIVYFEAALDALKKFGKSKRGLLSGKIAVGKSKIANTDKIALKTAKEICDTTDAINEAKSKINSCTQEITGLEIWRNYDLPLDSVGTSETRLQLGYFPQGTQIEAVESMLGEIPPLYDIQTQASDKRGVFVSVMFHKSISSRFSRILTECGFTRLDFKEIHSTASEAIISLKEQKKEAEEEYSSLLEKLKSFGPKQNDIEIAYDAEKTALAEIEAKQKLYCTDKTVYLSAWTPRKAVKAVTTALNGLDLWYSFSDPEPDDDVPISLDNKSFAKPFEGVVEMYSMPKYLSFDPTLIMSIFYFVVFGLMLADVGYGLELIFGGLFLLKKMKPTGSTKNLLKLVTICGISSTVCGVLFGSYFGDLPIAIATNLFHAEPFNIALLFDVVKEPMSFLYISLGVGALHLLTGMGIKFYMLCKQGKPLDAIFDVGSWYVLLGGIGMLLVVPSVGKYVAIAGVAMLILTQGRAEKNIVMKFLKGLISLYDLISYISDLLSYSRIMAMGLASAVIAQVFNILGTMGGFVGVILMVLIGHTMNLAISVLGTYVHNCRLQYIEFFGKFYEDGGRPFRPVRPELKFTEITEETTK